MLALAKYVLCSVPPVFEIEQMPKFKWPRPPPNTSERIAGGADQQRSARAYFAGIVSRG
jgi:hypothetical protein